MGSLEKGLGILIVSFSDFLRRLFEGKDDTTPSEKELKRVLNLQANLTLKETLEVPFEKMFSNLEKLKTKDLDRLIIYLYNQFIEKKTDSPERLKKTIVLLVKYLDEEREGYSLDRSNIKNSLLHKELKEH